MIFSLDIETARNADCISEITVEVDARLTDPEKIEKDRKKKMDAAIGKMGLDPFTGRICTYAMRVKSDEGEYSTRFAQANALNDNEERRILVDLFESFSASFLMGKIITWNGLSFDIPYIYARAMKLGVVPPVSMKTLIPTKYSTERHIDLCAVLTQYKGYLSLENAASFYTGSKKYKLDVANNHKMIEEGNADKIKERCISDATLTLELYEKSVPYFF